MRWTIEGLLLVVQGSIERALEIIEAEGFSCQQRGSSASSEYQFSHSRLGTIGRVKISILPNNITELYGYAPDQPNNTWMVEYLSTNVPSGNLSHSLKQLLLTYAWQIEHNVFDLSTYDIFRLADSTAEIDYGWSRHGLDDQKLRNQAIAAMQDWKKRIHSRRQEEFNELLGIIETQLQMDGLPVHKTNRAELSREFDSELSSSEVQAIRQTDDGRSVTRTADQLVKETRIPVGKYDDLCRLWVNRPYIPKQTKAEFLDEHASELDRKSFDRILKDAYKRGVIDKDPGPHGRYKPKTVP